MPVSAGRKTHSSAAQAASYGPHPAAAGTSKPIGPSKAPARKLSPDAAATRIQAAWRSARLARHRPALKQLAAAAAQLRQLTEQLHQVQRQQPGVPLTQKQYLELSEPVMKVLFALDAVSCGSAVELRSKRKELTTRANKLLDAIQAAQKPAAAGAVPNGSTGAAAAAVGLQQQQQPQQQQQQQQPSIAEQYRKKSWFRR
jgi:hypothetical protein